MKRIVFGAACLAACAAVGAMRPTPEYLKSAVVYQMVLRNFTRDGNFKAATEMLEHVRSAGVDVVYLTPFVEMDCDMDETGWSPRQIMSAYHTPKNPYRISNYDRIDPEYGHDADFKAFNDKAHALNTFFAPVEDIARARKTVDWGRALQPAGQKRLALIRALAKMRHEQPIFANGSQEWVVDGEKHGVVSFVRRAGGKAVFVSANLTDKAASFSVKGLSPNADKPLLAENGKVSTDGAVSLGPWGFVVVAVK